MTAENIFETEAGRIDALAADWVLRQDRGLAAAEQDELSQWLGTDVRHRAAFAEHSRGWDELDRLAGLQASVHAMPDPDLLAPRREPVSPRRPWLLYAPLGMAAAALVFALFSSAPPPASGPPPARWAPVAQIEERRLTDGSEVQLNRGSVLAVEFTPTERRVRLLRGEAHFSVAKNPLRPFVVVAHGVEVQAVGTVFNVRLAPSAVEVLVTEGKVHVEHPDEHSPSGMSAATPLLLPGDHAVVPLYRRTTAYVAQLSAEEIAEKLAWQPRLLDFSDATLADIAAEFNQHNPVRLVLADPALGRVRLSATFRSDNIEGFVRLMESDFGMRAVRSDEAEIQLQH